MQPLPRASKSKIDTPHPWRTVRVFISSTFRDMHAERDHLVKVVFPELRERMAQRNLHLVDIDLRWGITEAEAEQGKVLEICLDEIERSRPFFIGILGERYGSVLDTLPEDAELTHPWLAAYGGHSLTALEIVHGVIRNPDLARRSFFYFRDPHFISQIPERQRADFHAENAESEKKVAALKNAVRASGRPVLESYPALWDAAQGGVVDLDVFGQRVLEDLWTAICCEYPEEAGGEDPLTLEREMHEAFVEERTRLHIRRVEYAAQLTGYVQDMDRRPVVITGESGCGKSAFLADWYRQYTADHPDDLVLAYFVGASPASTHHLQLLRNMCAELKRICDLTEEIPVDDKEVPETLASLLHAALETRPRIVIVMDALDQLSPLGGAQGLGWLLDYLPGMTQLVVSTLEGDCLDVLRRHAAQEIMLPPLSRVEQWQIVQALLGEWRRKLDDRQMAALLAHPGVKNPLYLRVALEELRLFGSFEQLTARIESLASDIVGLFDQVLARLEHDHGDGLVEKTFALIGCSRYGLSEAELLELLRQPDEPQTPRASWARLTRSAKAYLVRHGELFGFLHRQLIEAVAARYSQKENKHARLATYFAKASIDRKLDEYAYQLQQAEDWPALAATLTDLELFEYARENHRKEEWLGYWRALQGRFDPPACYQEALDERIKQEGESQSVAKWCSGISELLHDMTLLQPATLFEEKALAIRERISGLDHLDLAPSLKHLAELLENQNKNAMALSFLERALSIYRRALGADSFEVAECLFRIARLHFVKEDWTRGTPLIEGAMKTYGRIVERYLRTGSGLPVDLRSAHALHNMGEIMLVCHRYSDAEIPLREAIAIRERILGSDNLVVGLWLMDLGVALSGQGKFDELMKCQQRYLAIFEKTLGPDNAYTATALNNMAGSYFRQGNLVAAESMLLRALEIRTRILGPNSEPVALSLLSLGEFHKKQGQGIQALPFFYHALAIWDRALHLDPGVNVDLYLNILDNLSYTYARLESYGKAVTLMPKALRLYASGMGNWIKADMRLHWKETLVVITIMGLCVWFKLLTIPLAVTITVIAMVVPAVIRFIRSGEGSVRMFRLIRNYLVWRLAQTIFSWIISFARLAGVIAPNVVVAPFDQLAAAYQASGRYEEAILFAKRYLRLQEQALGYDHHDLATTLNILAHLYLDQEQYSQALPLYQRALKIAESVPGMHLSEIEQIKINLKACQDLKTLADSMPIPWPEWEG